MDHYRKGRVGEKTTSIFRSNGISTLSLLCRSELMENVFLLNKRSESILLFIIINKILSQNSVRGENVTHDNDIGIRCVFSRQEKEKVKDK